MEERLFFICAKDGELNRTGQIALLLLQAIHEGAGEKCKDIREYIVEKGYVELTGKLTERGERTSLPGHGNSKWTDWLNRAAASLRDKKVLQVAKACPYRTWRTTDLAEVVRRELIEELRQMEYTDRFIFEPDFYNYVTASI